MLLGFDAGNASFGEHGQYDGDFFPHGSLGVSILRWGQRDSACARLFTRVHGDA